MEKKIHLSFNKNEFKIVLNALSLLKELKNMPDKNVVLNELINKIYESGQSFIDDGLIDQKEIFKSPHKDQIYNELISLFDKAEEAITVSVNENIKYANPAFIRMLGYKSENEIIKLGLFNLISKRYLTEIKDYYKKRLNGEIVPNIHDLELKRADGRMILIECVHYCMPFKDFNLIISFYIDLKKIKSLEKKLRESEERYRVLFENSPIGIYIANSEGNVFASNKALRELTGFTLDELNEVGLVATYVDPSDRERLIKILEESGKVRDYEVKLKRKDGTEYVASLNIDTIELSGEGFLLVTEQDINKRKQAEQILKESEDKLKGIISSIPDQIIIIDKNFNILFSNNVVKELYGRSALGDKCYKFFQGVNHVCDDCHVQETFSDGKIHQHECKRVIKDGNKQHCWCISNVAMRDEEGKPSLVLDISRVITRHKIAEQKLKESEEKFKNIFLDSPIGIELYDSEGKLLNVNQVCLDVFGVSDVTEIKGFKLFNDLYVLEEEMEKLRRGESVRYETAFDFEKVKKFNLYETTRSGIINIDVQITPLYLKRIEKISNYLVQVQDITERKRLEDKIREHSD